MNIYVNGEYQIISTDYFLSLFGELFPEMAETEE